VSLIGDDLRAYNCVMAKSTHRRALAIMTTLVVIMMLATPVVSLANCCCVANRLSNQLGLSSESCCERPEARSCCDSVGDHAAACQTSIRLHWEHDSCQCDQACGRQPAVVAVAPPQEPDSLRPLAIDPVIIADLAIVSGLVGLSMTSGRDRSACYLSAPHRCATLCRWLN